MKKNLSKSKFKAPVIRYFIDMFKEGNYFVGVARGLDYTGIGKTIDEAKRNTDKSVKLAFEWCYKKNTLDKILKEAGFETYIEDGELVWDNRNYIGSFQSKVVA